jgi:hypothetical protein
MWIVFYGNEMTADKPVIVEVQYGGENIILPGFRVRQRGLLHGTFRLPFNAIPGGATVGATGS